MNKYDPHQFAGRGQHPVHARMTTEGWVTPGVAFEDYSRMQTTTRKTSGERRLPTPIWALNNALLRRVLVHFMEERALSALAREKVIQDSRRELDSIPKRFTVLRLRREEEMLKERMERAKAAIITRRPVMLVVMDRLCAEYVELKQKGLRPEITDKEWNETSLQPFMEFAEGEARFIDEMKRRRQLEVEIEGIDTYMRYTVNGGADVVAAIVYLYYRTGLDSVGVGCELGLKPPHVRQTLWRLHRTVEKMEASHLLDTTAAKIKQAKAKRPRNASKRLYTPPLFE